MALQLVHSARHTEEPDAITERSLSLIQGGHDPAAEEAARVAEICRLRDAEIARISVQDAEAQRVHGERSFAALTRIFCMAGEVHYDLCG